MTAANDPVQTVLVTGGGGFVGRRLLETLRRRYPDWICDAPTGEELDIRDADAVARRIVQTRPDLVIHLAAVAAVTDSVRAPRNTWDVNLGGTLNLVLAMLEHTPDAHLIYISSAEVYGASLNDGPASETTLLQPVNPYAASKGAADILVRQAAASGLSATVVRPFNHTGAGQSEAFVAPAFAAQIARIEAGLQEPVISVGSLDDERDFLDVADVVDAYVCIIDRRADLPVGAVFNVASGTTVRIGDLLEQLLALSSVEITVHIDPDRLRPTPIPRVVGDATALRAQGWAPRTSLKTTLEQILADCRNRLGT